MARALRPQWRGAIGLVAACILASGCKTIDGGPDRLYTIDNEVSAAKSTIQAVTEKYYSGIDPGDSALGISPKRLTDSDLKFLRNEVIARRMYIIDVEYSEYEASLTSDRQKFGFLTTTTAAGLGIASTLTTPVRSAQMLSGIGAAVLASRGAFDSEVVLAKTIQIVQGYMRSERDKVASRQILPRLSEDVTTYPLSAALHDLEDYYRAGTFTAGLIPALNESGSAAKDGAQEKADLVAFGPDDFTKALRAFLFPGGKQDRTRVRLVNQCLKRFLMPVDIRDHLSRADSTAIRKRALQCAQEVP